MCLFVAISLFCLISPSGVSTTIAAGRGPPAWIRNPSHRLFSNLTHRFIAVDVRHHDIHQNSIDVRRVFQKLDPIAAILRALHKKSWAVIDRPYSLGCATVGAPYERPRCIFCAKPILRKHHSMYWRSRRVVRLKIFLTSSSILIGSRRASSLVATAIVAPPLLGEEGSSRSNAPRARYPTQSFLFRAAP